MALTKYEKLRRLMERLKNDQIAFTERVRQVFDHVKEGPGFLIFGKLDMEAPSFPATLKAHILAVFLLYPNIRLYFEQKKIQNIMRGHKQSILYCSSVNEMTNPIEWFESEDYASTISTQFEAMRAYYDEENILSSNIGGKVQDHFKSTVKEWRKRYPGKVSVTGLDFTPKDDDSISSAYEAVLTSIKLRKTKNEDLLALRRDWKNCLEKKIFQNLRWERVRQESWLHEWKNRFLKKSTAPANRKKERWVQGYAISREMASDLIMYFVDGFIKSPKKKHYGEIACILWTLIWISRKADKAITVESVIEMTAAHVFSREKLLRINGSEVVISEGLSSLYDILCGEGRGKRTVPMFPNIRNIDRLEAVLKRASRRLFPNHESVLPSAFLAFPHPLGSHVRIPKAQRKAMFSVRFNPKASIFRRELLSLFQQR